MQRHSEIAIDLSDGLRSQCFQKQEERLFRSEPAADRQPGNSPAFPA